MAEGLDELDHMRQRVIAVRSEIVRCEEQEFGRTDLSYLGRQSGMCSLLPLSSEQELALTRDHAIHVVKGGRINVARLSAADIPTLITAVHAVLGKVSLRCPTVRLGGQKETQKGLFAYLRRSISQSGQDFFFIASSKAAPRALLPLGFGARFCGAGAFL